MAQKTVILIAGPTASGKTALALDTALRLDTSIISADSRQCYRELEIGVAKPSSAELSAVKHLFINSHSIHEEVTAASYEQYALSAATEIFRHNDVLVLCGGTGLYIRAFLEGLDAVPEMNPGLRDELTRQYTGQGIGWLQEQLRLHDPLYSREGEMMNPQRMIRALEVKLSTGASIKELHSGTRVSRSFRTLKFAIAIPREELHRRIDIRVDEMITRGLEEEARSLYPYRHLNALQTVGYTELFGYFDGQYTLEEAIGKIKANTRKYAKRQLTWFRRDKEIKWISPSAEDILGGYELLA